MSDRLTLLLGDCREVMAQMPENSIDAIVTDPPYGIGFMGKEWDNFKPGYRADGWAGYANQPKTSPSMHAGKYDLRRNAEFQQWFTEIAVEMLRVLKPGGHLLSFGGSRTFHRMTCAIEDAGFEIRDCLMWLYASGFPKSLDVSKAIDKAAGAEREVVGANPNYRELQESAPAYNLSRNPDITAPATEAAKQWEGWGTALKPAYEPIILARKPLTGTVAANVQQWGTGGLNIDACRIEGAPRTTHADGNRQGTAPQPMSWGSSNDYRSQGGIGRWPPNVILDPEAARLLDAMSGESVSSGDFERPPSNLWAGDGGGLNERQPAHGFVDRGGASRFYFVPKTSRAEREYGLDGLEAKSPGELTDRKDGAAGTKHPRAGAGREQEGGGANGMRRRNDHPT